MENNQEPELVDDLNVKFHLIFSIAFLLVGIAAMIAAGVMNK